MKKTFLITKLMTFQIKVERRIEHVNVKPKPKNIALNIISFAKNRNYKMSFSDMSCEECK